MTDPPGNFHTIEDGPWPYGTTVAVWSVDDVSGGVPVGAEIDNGVAGPDGTVTFGGLTVGEQYTAFGHGGSMTFFCALSNDEAVEDLQDRVQAVEEGLELVADERTPLDAKLDGAAIGNGVALDGAAIKQLIATAGSVLSVKREVMLPPGTYLIDQEAILPNTGIKVRAPSRGSTVLKCAPSFAGFIFRASEVVSGTHGTMGPTTFEDIVFDGDAMNSTLAEAVGGNPLVHAYNASGVKFYRCTFQNGRSYGAGFQGYPDQANATARGPIEDILFESCEFRWNGFRKTGDATTIDNAIDASQTSIVLTSATGITSTSTLLLASGEKVQVTALAGTTATVRRGAYATTAAAQATESSVKELARYDDGLDCKSSQRATFIGCNFYGNADDGCDVRAHYLSMTGCYAWGNGNGGIVTSVSQPGNWLPESDGFAAINGCFGWDNGMHGLRAEVPAAGRVGRMTYTGCGARGNGLDNLELNGSGGGALYVTVNGGHFCNSVGGSGIRLNACTQAEVIGVHCTNNNGAGVGYGLQISNMPNGAGIDNCVFEGNERGLRATGTTDNLRISNCRASGNTTAPITMLGTKNRLSGNDWRDAAGAVFIATTVNSAATITPSQTHDVFLVAGSTNIDTITAGAAGRVIYLRFNGVLTLNDGTGNLKLAGNITTSADDVIALCCVDGVSWWQISALSAN